MGFVGGGGVVIRCILFVICSELMIIVHTHAHTFKTKSVVKVGFWIFFTSFPYKIRAFRCSGYVAEIRKKDWKRCYPFSLEGDQTETEEQTSFLPPLDVPKFRWWRCQNCLREVASKGAAKDNGTVLNCCSTKFRSNSTCSHVSSLGSAAVLLPGFQQAPKLVLDGRSIDANTSTKLSNDNHLLLCSDKKEKKVELANNTFIGTLQSSSVLLKFIYYLVFGSFTMFFSRE